VPEPQASVSAPCPRLALTGATGFVGRSLLARLDGAGPSVRALARAKPGRTLAPQPGLDWVPGGLDDPGALASLMDGAEVVLHCAGATNALTREAFHRVNAEGTAAVTRAAREAGVRHVILLSSLAATRPEVSDYAASKAAGEARLLAESGDMAVTILRAPAVVGPGDAATAPLFTMLARGWMPVIGGNTRSARFSVIDVEDLAALLLDLAAQMPKPGQRQDCAPYGHAALGWGDLAASAERVTGRRVRVVVLPRAAAVLLGRGADLVARVSGRSQVFSSGKVREMCAGDWIGDTPIAATTPIDETMGRCLAPFLRLGKAQE
jgi:nucleoside-diphosphate-sugar epimerase